MSVILSVYSKSALKEFVLPAVNNTELSLLLEGSVFQVQEDIELKLEVLSGEWYFQDTGERLHINENNYDGAPLKHQDRFTFVSKNEEVFAILVKIVESSFPIFEKYSLEEISKISIGSRQRKAISYSAYYGGIQIVSENHAELTRQSNGWMLEDQSANGTFVNDMRVGANRILEFGDHINIWGLRLVYR